MRRLLLSLAVFAGSGCTGFASDWLGQGPSTTPVVQAPVKELARLTREELDLTLAELTLDDTHAALSVMPGDDFTPFDNATARQLASAVWVEAAEQLAHAVATDTFASPSRRARVLPCTPTSDDDLACLEAFTRRIGRRALRRALTDLEVASFTDLHTLARQRGGFDASAALVLERLLLDPEFLFHVEVGTPVVDAPGTAQLSPVELASRLSFFLQGRGPTEALLDRADQGALATPDGVRAVASSLLEAPEGRAHVERYHAMWLGYLSLPHAADFNARLVTETSALVRKVVFEDRAPYRQLFLAQQTYVDDTLAAHYGLPATGTPGFSWVGYGNLGRMGILSHAALLSNGAKQTDTSPTLRGKWIRNRLFCQTIPPPPPNVAADVPPATTGAAVCKKDRYAVHGASAACAGCHQQMDPIGFGLEQYDRTGKFRSVEADHPECSIAGDGALEGVGSFNGPAGLAQLMVDAPSFDECVVKQVFRSAVGREETAEDLPLVRALAQGFKADERFDRLLVELTAHPTFSQRRTVSP